MLLKLFKILFSLFPDLTGFKEMGFTAHIKASELILQKNTKNYEIKFSQGLEPFSSNIKSVIDFDIPDGFFLVEFLCEKGVDMEDYEDDLSPLFQYTIQKGHFWFLFDKKLDFSTVNIHIKVEKLLKILDGINLK